MADGVVALQPDSTGKKVDTTELTVGSNTVERQRINLADPVGAALLANVLVPADATAAVSGGALAVASFPLLFNGTTFDRIRSGAAAADAVSAPTAGMLTAETYLRAYNGATFDRVRMSSAGALWVGGPAASGASISGNPVLAGWTFTTTLPTVTTGQAVNAQSTNRGELLVSLSTGGVSPAITAASTQPAFTSPALTVADRATGAAAATVPSSAMYCGATFTTTQPTVTTGQLVGLQTTSRGALIVSLASADNSATTAGFVKLTDGATAVPTTAASTAAATGSAALTVALSPNSPTPATTSANQACSSVNLNAVGATVTAVKASAGNLFGFSLINNNAAAVFVSFWNVGTASVTLGTTTPTCVFVIPASGTLTVPPAALALMNSGTAISVAAVTAFNGSTGGSVTGSVFFK